MSVEGSMGAGESGEEGVGVVGGVVVDGGDEGAIVEAEKGEGEDEDDEKGGEELVVVRNLGGGHDSFLRLPPEVNQSSSPSPLPHEAIHRLSEMWPFQFTSAVGLQVSLFYFIIIIFGEIKRVYIYIDFLFF